MLRFPFIDLKSALTLLRVVTPALFMAHAIGRMAYGTIPQFAQFMGNLGFPAPVLLVWAITLTELVAGTMVILNFRVRWAAAALAAIALGGIVLIHARIGWFVGEHGTGGSEYSVALLAMLCVIMANDQPRENVVGLGD